MKQQFSPTLKFILSYIQQFSTIEIFIQIYIKLKLTENNLKKQININTKNMIQSDRQNLEPNQSPQLGDLIRDNIEYQQNQNIKNILYKQSLVKISLDKDFEHLFDRQAESVHESQKYGTSNLVQVTNQIKQVCNWLEECQEFKGMAYLPYLHLPKLLHILHQKVQSTIIVVTDYHTVWLEKMQELARLYKIKWGFLNSQLDKQQKIKVLQLYQMKKLKLFFISPSIFKFQSYLEFNCDLLVLPDLHLYINSQQFVQKIIDKCSPGRTLALYSTLMNQIYSKSNLQFTPINKPKIQNSTFLSLKTQNQQKFKTLITYLQRNQYKRNLLIVRDKAQAINLSKLFKMKSMTSLNIFDYLTNQQMQSFTSPQILYRANSSNTNDLELKIMDIVYKSRNYEITISRYFDALRFANYQSVIFYNFVSVPHFIEYCPDIQHRLTLLSEDDYYRLRNQITSQHITLENLTKIVMKIMERPKKKQSTSFRKFYSDYVQDKLLDVYSVSKNYVQKNQEKVIRINWFCKNYDITQRQFKKVIDGLQKNQIVKKDCKLVYQIQIQQESLSKFRKLFPQTIQIRRKINLLNLSTAVQKTTRVLLQQLKKQSINYKITQKALQLKIIKNYDEVEWTQLWKIVNKSVTDSALDLDRSYYVYKQCSYGSVELTRRQKHLQRKKDILNFYSFDQQQAKQTNILDSSHKSNLLTSEIQQWIRHSNEISLDDHQLILLLQGVQIIKTGRFKQQPIFGRYKKYKYQDLSQIVQKIYKNKKVKR